MKRALKMHLISGNDLKTFLLHRTAFLCVSRFLRLASFGTVNALMIVISVTFQPLFSVIPEIFRNFVPGISLNLKIVTMRLPEDPVMLYSFINMKLRDFYPSLDALCEDMNVEKEDIVRKLKLVGFEYNPAKNRFW